MKPMSRVLLPILLVLTACSRENKAFYSIHVGETMDLYLGTNSCCLHCWIDSAQVSHVRWISEEVIETSPLDGGSGRMIWTFQGMTPGIDTLRIAWIPAGNGCEVDDSTMMGSTKSYVV